MLISEEERKLLSERIKSLKDMGGIKAVARKSRVCRPSIYRILGPPKEINLRTYRRILTGISKLERSRSRTQPNG